MNGLAVICGVIAVSAGAGLLAATGPTALAVGLLVAAILSLAVAVWVATTP